MTQATTWMNLDDIMLSDVWKWMVVMAVQQCECNVTGLYT